MGKGIEITDVKVPIGLGHIVGDFIRKFAIRGVPSCQIIGYQIQSSNFGLGNGQLVSCKELISGKLENGDDEVDGDPRICKFTWNGKEFVSGEMRIKGLTKAVGEQLNACIFRASGSRSASQNHEIYDRYFGTDGPKFYAVPSNHSSVKEFRFNVKPFDDKSEWLCIESDEGVARMAYDRALSILRGLDI